MTLITVGFVRTDLFSAWQSHCRRTHQNRFLINIQQDQIGTIQSLVPKTADGKPGRRVSNGARTSGRGE